MGCNARLILGFRAAGLLLLGLTLNEVVNKVAGVVLDQRILDLRRGHPDAILGMLDTLVTVAADVLHWSAIFPFAAAVAGIAMFTLPRDRIAQVIQKTGAGMSYFVWFRLLVRAIGLLLIGLGLPYTFSMIGWFIAILEESATGFNHTYGLREATYLIAAFTQLGFGLWLFFAPGRIVRFCLRDVQGCCIACGYDLRALASPSCCPECGLPIDRTPGASDTPPPPTTPASPRP